MVHNSELNWIKMFLFTVLALIAFAANSVLCRLALNEQAIDAASFTVIRLLAGALVLFFLIKINRGAHNLHVKGSWFASFMLLIYAISFSFSYITLDTGTGALILFGSVQMTMIGLSIILGNRLHAAEWLGVVIAFGGLVYLLWPGAAAPSLSGFLLMTLAGIAWGCYTMMGRSSTNPLMDTTYNFIRTVPFVILLAILTIQTAHYSFEGVLLAILSGGMASAVGYTLWYLALGGLSAVGAAVVQLSVPIIAAMGGVIFVSETITLSLILSAAMVLGGILLVLSGRYYFTRLKL